MNSAMPPHENPVSTEISSTPQLGAGEKCAMTGIVLGLFSLLLSFILPMGLVIGIPAFIVSFLGRKSRKRNLARFGMITAAVGIAVSLALLILTLTLMFGSGP